MERLDLESIERAARRLRDEVRRTPLVTSGSISSVAECELVLKAESFQRTGSFKYRGTYNAAAIAHEIPRTRPLRWVLASSGNFGQAAAAVGRRLGFHVTVFMPDDAPGFKAEAVTRCGATLLRYEAGRPDVREMVEHHAHHVAGSVVSSSSVDAIPAGHATLAVEVLEDVPDVGAILVPVGAGGLAAGVGTYVRAVRPDVQVVGVRAGASSPGWSCLDEEDVPRTIADGLRIQVTPKRRAVLRSVLSDLVTVEDADVAEAMGLLIERAKLVVEPTGAVALAAALRMGPRLGASGKVVAVVTGGNIAAAQLATLLAPTT